MNGALFLGGPLHGEVRAVLGPVFRVAIPTPFAFTSLTAPLEPVPYETVRYNRRRNGARVPAAAVGGYRDRLLRVSWDIYVREGSEVRADRYIEFVHLLLLLTGRLEAGGAGLWITHESFVDG